MRYVLLIAAIVTGYLAMGCAGKTPAQVTTTVVSAGADVLECAPDEYAAVKTAIESGGSAWIAVVLGALKCVIPVVKDIQTALACSPSPDRLVLQCDRKRYLAQAGNNMMVLPVTLSKGARSRMATSKLLADLLMPRLKP